MKKVLLGTTALAALVALPLTAQSAEKIKLGLGGYYRAMVVWGNQDDGAVVGDEFRDHGIARESEIYFSGKTTLDNGIKVGVMVQLEGETTGDQIDNSYIWTAGGFGRVELGSTWSPSVIMSKGSVGEMLDSHSDFASHIHVRSMTGQYLTTYGGNSHLSLEPDDILVYYSPRMGGFQLGIGYSPEDKTGGDEDTSALDSEVDGTMYNEMLDVAVNYIGKFGGASVALFGSLYTTETEPTAVGAVAGADAEGFSVGGQISMSGFTVGGRYTETDDRAGAGLDRESWRMGVAYGTGPWTVGAVYYSQDDTRASGQDDEMRIISVGAQYAVGPGIKLFGGVQDFDWEDDGNNPANEGDATVVVLGTKLSF